MYFKDGTSYTNEVYLLGDELDLDEAEADVTGKYEEIMEPRVGKSQMEKIQSVLSGLDDLKTISNLTVLLKN